jgi:CHAD domain-containing protein
VVKDGVGPDGRSTVEHVETERKYEVPDPATAVALEHPFSLGKPRTFHLGADYVDTVDHVLTEAGYSLRRRTGGADEGWHLKFPKVGDSRRELHAPLAAGATAAHVPRALRAEIEDVVDLAPLVPVARLDTERTEREVRRHGVVVARLADDRVRATTPGTEPTRWREVEVELVDPDPEVLEAIEEQLRARGLEPSKSASKISRALEAGAAKKGRKKTRTTAGDVVLAHLRIQVGVLQGLEGAVRRDEPDAVHKARVATRRLRSTLRTYRRLFRREVTDPLRAEAKWLGEFLGAPRDAEVLKARVLEDLDRLEQPGEDLVVGPVRERLTSRLTAEHRAAHEVLVHALNSERHHRLMESLVALLTEPPLRGRAGRSAKKVLPAIAARAERRVEEARERVRETSDEAARLPLLHDVRKKAKAARYAYDALVPVFGDDAEEASGRWEHVTEELGEFQDTIVVTARLRDFAAAAEAADESAFTYGVLVEREQERGRAALAAAEEHLDAAPGGLDG